MPVFVGAGGTFDSKVSGGGQGVSVGTTDTTGRNAVLVLLRELSSITSPQMHLKVTLELNG